MKGKQLIEVIAYLLADAKDKSEASRRWLELEQTAHSEDDREMLVFLQEVRSKASQIRA